MANHTAAAVNCFDITKEMVSRDTQTRLLEPW